MDSNDDLSREWLWARRKLRELLQRVALLNSIEFRLVAMLRDEVQR